jgi:hypothetical protein
VARTKIRSAKTCIQQQAPNAEANEPSVCHEQWIGSSFPLFLTRSTADVEKSSTPSHPHALRLMCRRKASTFENIPSPSHDHEVATRDSKPARPARRCPQHNKRQGNASSSTQPPPLSAWVPRCPQPPIDAPARPCQLLVLGAHQPTPLGKRGGVARPSPRGGWHPRGPPSPP